eukprot:gene23705-9248_t
MIQASNLVAACLASAAAVLHKQENKALEFDPYNVEAFFQRSQGYYRRDGGTVVGLEASTQDLKQAMQLEPANDAIRALYEFRQAELYEQYQRETASSGKIFDGGAELSTLGEDPGELGASTKPPGSFPTFKGMLMHLSAPFLQLPGSFPTEPMPSERELSHTFKGMHRHLEHLRIQREREEQLRMARGSNTERSVMATFAMVPWWGWMLIVLHLAYRIVKVVSNNFGKKSIMVDGPHLGDMEI